MSPRVGPTHPPQKAPQMPLLDCRAPLSSRLVLGRPKAAQVLHGDAERFQGLANLGVRAPDANWQLSHLYAPKSVTPNSTMPSFKFLFEVCKFGAKKPRREQTHATFNANFTISPRKIREAFYFG